MARTRTRRRALRLDLGTLGALAVVALVAVDYLRTHPAVTTYLLLAVTITIVALIAVLHRRVLHGRPITSPMRMSPAAFEQHIAGLLARSGAREVRVSGGAGDLGADVVAVDQYGQRVVVQCKRYGPRHKVGSEDMQRFVGTARPHHRADVALFVTTSRFTKPARDFAQQHAIVTVDGTALAKWGRTRRAPWESLTHP